MAVPTRFEPAIFCVTGRRVNPYTTEPYFFFLKLFKYTKKTVSLSSTIINFFVIFYHFDNLYDKTKPMMQKNKPTINSLIVKAFGIKTGIEPITKPMITIYNSLFLFLSK